MIQQGSKPLVETGNKNIVTALREIAAGKVWFEPRKNAAEEAVDASFEETQKEILPTPNQQEEEKPNVAES